MSEVSVPAGRPKSARVFVSDEDLRLLRDVLRLVAAYDDRESVPDVWLKDWNRKAPKLTESLYRRFIASRHYPTDFREQAICDRQLESDWTAPHWSTYCRYIQTRDPSGIPIERLEDFIFIARGLLWKVEFDQETDTRATYARKGSQSLKQGLGPIEALLSGLKSPILSVTASQSGGITFQHVCAELLAVFRTEARFVQPNLITEQRPLEGANWGIKGSYSDLQELVNDTKGVRLVVLLGDPGAGKTTLMRRQYAALLSNCAKANSAPVPLLVSLGSKANRVDMLPEEFLAELWSISYGDSLPSLPKAVREGRVFLLIDGFNEVSNWVTAERWKQYLHESFLVVPGNRALVSCRKFDYALPLGTSDVYVPHVRIAPLGPVEITNYLQTARSDIGLALANKILGDPALISLYGSPFLLRVLADTVDDSDSVYWGKTSLLVRLTWNLLFREITRNPSSFHEPLFSALDRLRIANSPTFPNTISLPDQGSFIQFLSDLATKMRGGTGIELHEAESVSVEISLDDAKRCIKVALSASILTFNLQDSTIRFAHHLLQELFAARIVAKEFDDRLWSLKWRQDDLPAFKPRTLHEQLPSLPLTGWEETTVMAAVMSKNKEDFVSRVFDQNCLLAGRCVNSAEIEVSKALDNRIQLRLLELRNSSAADFRARLEAGLLIRDLEIIGYNKAEVHGHSCIIPPTVLIAAGSYPIGARTELSSGLKWHANQLTLGEHIVQLASIGMSCYHVTNAEFALFIAASGYQNDNWWPGQRALRWRNGDDLFTDLMWQLNVDVETHRKWGADYINGQVGLRWTAERAEEMIDMLNWPPEQKHEWLLRQVGRIGKPSFPGLWFNNDFNAASQPVVAVSWYEASAYCLWLSAMTGETYRLPTEIEYEAVARALVGMAVPYGDEPDPTKSNIRSSRVWRPTPVGLYQDGQFQGIHDLIGNVWTWTSSLDLGEDGQYQTELRRTARGGSYDTAPELAKAYFRDSNHPGYRDRYIGFRMVKQPH